MKLDADALTDMGLSETARNSITVSQIAARMRAVNCENRAANMLAPQDQS